MADYTPTTDQVRELFHVANSSLYQIPARINFPAFDRWLAAHDAEKQAEVIDWIEGYYRKFGFDWTCEKAREHFGVNHG